MAPEVHAKAFNRIMTDFLMAPFVEAKLQKQDEPAASGSEVLLNGDGRKAWLPFVGKWTGKRNFGGNHGSGDFMKKGEMMYFVAPENGGKPRWTIEGAEIVPTSWAKKSFKKNPECPQ